MRRPRLFRVAALSLLFITGLGATGEPAGQLAPDYEFSFPGGLARWYDDHRYFPPHTLEITRTFLFGGTGEARSCTYEVPACGQTDDVDSCDLEEVLLDRHVLALWPDEGEKVYGGDARHYDGVVFTIGAPEKGRLAVGELCRDESAECLPEHQSLLRLRSTFTELRSQANASSQCENLEN
jgi:hypothetical protein